VDTKEHLEKFFSKAGIPVKVTDRGFVRGLRGAANVTQIDIDTSGKQETVRCFPGEDSEIRVLNVDRDHQQVVLSVLEPERTFTERQSLPWGKRDPETGKRYSIVERVTPKEERRLLIGMDERHLFVAQMGDGNKPTTVKKAHRALAPAGVPGTRRKRKKEKIIRQGEWFFVPVTETERDAIEQAIKDGKLEKKVALGSDGGGRQRGAGKPHTVQERIRLGVNGTTTRVSRFLTRVRTTWRGSYVRGWVRHADHKTVKLRDWHRVNSNTEDRSSTATWVD
jgi:hypothetical protein